MNVQSPEKYELNQEDKQNLQEIVNNVLNGNKDWFESHGILIGEKGNYWVLNYIQSFIPNRYNLLTRGLIVDKTNGKIVSMPFKRFGNYGEDFRGYKTVVDFSKSEVLEKLDGSMLAVAFPDNDHENPLYHTKRMVSGFSFKAQKGFDGEEVNLMKIAGEYVKQINFSANDTDKTWVFELIHNERPVITKYEKSQVGLYLIGARNLNTFDEYSEEQLDKMASVIGVKRPRRWGVMGSHEAVKQMMAQFPEDFEGFVVRQVDDGQRAKVKSLDYLKRHSLIGGSSFKNIIPLWVSGETSEILTYFPESKVKFEILENAFQKKLSETLVVVHALLKNKYSNKKDLSLAMKTQNISVFESSMAFNCFEKPQEQFSHLIEQQMKKLAVYKIIGLLGLPED